MLPERVEQHIRRDPRNQQQHQDDQGATCPAGLLRGHDCAGRRSHGHRHGRRRRPAAHVRFLPLAGLDEPPERGQHGIVRVDELHPHAGGRALSLILFARPHHAAQRGPWSGLARYLDLQRDALADCQRLRGADEEAARSQVECVGLHRLAPAALVNHAQARHADARGGSSFVGHGATDLGVQEQAVGLPFTSRRPSAARRERDRCCASSNRSSSRSRPRSPPSASPPRR
jgi:hypothetical protein